MACVATKAWIANAVDCASDARPAARRKPPSLFCCVRRYASARATGFPLTPAALSASIAAAVSFESGLPPRSHEKPPFLDCDAEEVRDEHLRRRTACLPDRQDRPHGLVHLRRCLRQPCEQRGGVSSERRFRERDQGNVRRLRQLRLMQLEVRQCVARVASARPQTERGPRRELRIRNTTGLRETAIGSLPRLRGTPRERRR